MEGRKEIIFTFFAIFTMVAHHTKEKIWRGVATTAQWLRVLGFGIRPWFESSL